MAAVSDQPGVDEASPDPLRHATPMDMENGGSEADLGAPEVCCVCQESGELLPCKVSHLKNLSNREGDLGKPFCSW